MAKIVERAHTQKYPWLGDHAMAALQDNYPTIAIALAAMVAMYVVGRRLLGRSAPAQS